MHVIRIFSHIPCEEIPDFSFNASICAGRKPTRISGHAFASVTNLIDLKTNALAESGSIGDGAGAGIMPAKTVSNIV